MTTFDAQGRIRSAFIPPTDENGEPISHREWLKRHVVRRLQKGELREDIEAWLARILGEHTIWHGYSDHLAGSVREAVSALRDEAGFPGRPTNDGRKDDG